jgi:4'-phosphopantetheinyl transferase EntD
MIESLLPAGAVGHEVLGDAHVGSLFPEEEQLVARAVDKRKREFAVGRGCARRVLAELGFDAVPILSGEKREPLWPPGVLGSITHCHGYAAAVAARAGEVAVLGIDAEPDEPLPDGVLGVVSLPEERAWLDGVPGGGPRWDRMLFSAKESVYKAWFPLTGRWLGFEDARLTFSPGDGTFQADVLVAPAELDGRPVTGFAGRFLAANGLVLTAITAALHEV